MGKGRAPDRNGTVGSSGNTSTRRKDTGESTPRMTHVSRLENRQEDALSRPTKTTVPSLRTRRSGDGWYDEFSQKSSLDPGPDPVSDTFRDLDPDSTPDRFHTCPTVLPWRRRSPPVPPVGRPRKPAGRTAVLSYRKKTDPVLVSREMGGGVGATLSDRRDRVGYEARRRLTQGPARLPTLLSRQTRPPSTALTEGRTGGNE